MQAFVNAAKAYTTIDAAAYMIYLYWAPYTRLPAVQYISCIIQVLNVVTLHPSG